MSLPPIVAGLSNQWLRQAFKSISVEHAAEAETPSATAAALKLTEQRIEQVAYVPSVDTKGAVENLIEAARRHGEDSDPDHEVGDLQDVLRAAWALLTPYQRTILLATEDVSRMIEGATGDPLVTDAGQVDDWDQVCEHFGLDQSFQYSDPQILEYTNMYRLEALEPEKVQAAEGNDSANCRYVHGTWEHIFPPGRVASVVRLVYDREQNALVTMEIRHHGGWTAAKQDEIADVEDSLKNANDDALEHPEAWGLKSSDDRPNWCQEEARQLTAERPRA